MTYFLDAELEPPGLPEDDDGPPDPCIAIHVGVHEADGTRRSAYATVAPDATDADVAGALAACLRGVAALRGPGLVRAVEGTLR